MVRILHRTDNPQKSLALLNSINVKVDVWAIAATDEEVKETADLYEVVLSETPLDVENNVLFSGDAKSAEKAISKFLTQNKEVII